MRPLTKVLAVLGFSVTMALPCTVQGQTTLGLLHGFTSSPSTWDNAVTYFSGWPLQIKRPALEWRYPYWSQAASVVDSFNTDAIVAGHSNGGIVSRLVGQDKPLRGVITFGSPNSGAPLVDNASQIPPYILGTVESIANAAFTFLAYQFLPYDDLWIYDMLSGYLLEAEGWINDLSSSLTELLGIWGLPVTSDMSPYWFPYSVNSPSALAAEQTNIGQTVGVTFVTDNWYFAGPWRLLAPGSADGIGWTLQAIGSTLEYWGDWLIETSDCDPEAMYESEAEADALYNVADNFLGVDPSWCDWVGGDGGCGPSDEVVPLWSQQYGAQVIGPSATHVQETGNGYSAIGVALQTYFNIYP